MSVNARYGDSLDPTLLTFTIQPRSGVDPARTEKALYEELERLQTAQVPARGAAESQESDAGRSLPPIEDHRRAGPSQLGTYEVF